MPERNAVAIPHAPPLRFARRLRAEAERVVVEAMVPAGCPADAAGSVPPAWLVEVAAQAAAAWRGGHSQAVRDGRLVGLGDWRSVAPGQVDEPLAVDVRHDGDFGSLSAFTVRVTQAGHELASGRLQVHLAE